MTPTTSLKSRARKRGSTLVAALAVLALTSIIIGSALMEAGHRFRTSHQSSRWSQAAHAAEAGIELAMMSAQENSWTADGWSAAPGTPGSPSVDRSFALASAAPMAVNAEVSVEKVMVSSTEWLRIQAIGKADLPGGAVAGIDSKDILLRKLSLRVDRSNGLGTGGTPRATRTFEALAEPVARSPFKYALLLDRKVSMVGNSLLDSFDSSDPAKSTNGLYDVLKRQSNADVGINDTQGTTDLGDSYVYGALSSSGPSPSGTGNVQGPISDSFDAPIREVRAPVWTSFNPKPTAIAGPVTLTGGPASSPARYKVSSVNLAGGDNVVLESHVAGTESFIEVWVTSDFNITGNASIIQKPGVHVIYHVEGNVDLTGSSLLNESNKAENNVMNVITPPAGVSQTVRMAGNGTTIGAINAPGADFTLVGNGEIHGALIGRTIRLTGNGAVHYDEALGRADIGNSKGYRIRSLVEAVR